MPKIRQEEGWGDGDAGHCPSEAQDDGDGELLPFQGTGQWEGDMGMARRWRHDKGTQAKQADMRMAGDEVVSSVLAAAELLWVPVQSPGS